MSRRELGEDLPHSEAAIWRSNLPVWAALVALVIATLGLAYVPLGPWNMPLSIAIAAIKAVIVAIWFMNLRRPDPLLRLTGVASLLWIAFMFALTFADLLTRAPVTQAGRVTPRAASSADVVGERLF